MANTKMECTSMVMLSEGSSAKAVATVTLNDEFVLKGIKVYEGKNGLFVSMPSRKSGNDYQDVVFPITKEAREQLNNTVMESYGKLVENGLDKLPLAKSTPPEQSVSKITVTLHQVDDEKTKAVGQIVIDDCIVVSGVKVRHGTNSEGVKKDFVSMPSYQTQTGEYNEYAHSVTKDCYEKINNAVLGTYETLQKTEYKGVKMSELGEKGQISSKYGMNNTFAEKLMAELDKKGITYSARVSETTVLSVKNLDKEAVDKIQKDLSTKLTNEKQTQQQSKPKKAR
ncbi:MAG: septation protein SpoVG family protein [Oscillospiraceae bacterium]